MRIATLFLLILATGCSGLGRAPATAPAPAGQAVVPAPPASTVPKAQAAANSASTPAAAPAKSESAPATAPAKGALATAAPAPAKQPAPAAKPPAPPAMDLPTLEKKLKETNAIGVLTKLKLKNEIDDLLGRFRAYYQGQLSTTLAELRQPFETLFMKVLSLIQDSDPNLAKAIAASREAIWGILSDRSRFANL